MPFISIISTIIVLVLVITVIGLALYNSISRSSRARGCSMCPHSSECKKHDIKKCEK